MQRPADSDYTASPGAAGGSNSPSLSPEPPSRRRPKRSGTERKTQTTRKNGNGRNITLEDLRAHFRLSLGEAAQRLGVCASTLKRVCRRKGIPAWPQRKLVKLSRAVDQVSAAHKGLSPPSDISPSAGFGSTADEAQFASHLTLAYYTGYGDDHEGGAESEAHSTDIPPAAPLDIGHNPHSGVYKRGPLAGEQSPLWSRLGYQQGYDHAARDDATGHLPPRFAHGNSRLTGSQSADLGHLSRMDPSDGRLPSFAAAPNKHANSLRGGEGGSGNGNGGSSLFLIHDPVTASGHSEHSSYQPPRFGGAAANDFGSGAASQHSPNGQERGPYLPDFARITGNLHNSLSLPELQQGGPLAEPQPGGRQQNDSSSEEVAFRTEALGACFARFNPPPLSTANGRGHHNADGHHRTGGRDRDDRRDGHGGHGSLAASLGLSALHDHHESHGGGGHGGGGGGGGSSGGDAHTDASHGLPANLTVAASHGGGAFVDFPSPRAELAFHSSSAFHDSVASLNGGIAGSLGGVGPGFASGAGGGGSHIGGTPGYTSSGYHGMQLSAVCSDIARQLASWRQSPHSPGLDVRGAGGADHAGTLHLGSGGTHLAQLDAIAAAAAAIRTANHEAAIHEHQHGGSDGSGTDRGTPPELHSPTAAAMFGACASPVAEELSPHAGLTPAAGEQLWWAK